MKRHDCSNFLFPDDQKNQQKPRILDLSGFWNDADGFDFEETDRLLNALSDQDRVLLRVDLNAPLPWLKKNLHEVCVMQGQSSDESQILKCLSENGINESRKPMKPHRVRMSAFWAGPLPMDSEKLLDPLRIYHTSIASRKWVECACEAFRRLIGHVESSIYSNSVLGYIPVFGQFNLNRWWTIQQIPGAPAVDDLGPVNTDRFQEWCRKNGSNSEDIALPETVIHFDEVFRTDSLLPAEELNGLLSGSQSSAVLRRRYRSQVCMEVLQAFSDVIHQNSDRLCGLYCLNPEEPGATDGISPMACRLSESKTFDFCLTEPAAFSFCSGEPGGADFHADSLPVLNEIHPVYLQEQQNGDKRLMQEDFCLTRDVCRSIVQKHGLAETEMPERLTSFFTRHCRTDTCKPAQVLLVSDEESALHMSGLYGIHTGLGMRLERELRLCGAAIDSCNLTEMPEKDLSSYRLIVFRKAFALDTSLWQKIQPRLRPDVYLLWNYAAGRFGDDAPGITGFTVQPIDRLQHPDVYHHVLWHIERSIPQDYPRLHILPEPGMQILQRSPEGKILTASKQLKGYRSIYAADLTLRTEMLRRLIIEAGIVPEAPEGCAVYRTDNILSYFAHDDGIVQHSFPGVWRDIRTGNTISGSLSLPLRAGEFAVFESANAVTQD